MKMFDIFGEFDSAEEINEAAAAQLAEGDIAVSYTHLTLPTIEPV